MELAVRSPLVEAMLDPAFYPHRPDAVELRETHISWVFRAGPLAYKVKKPLVTPFLDYRTAERRHRMCREEVRLNRRLAPDVYRRVVAIVPSGDGYALAEENASKAIDYAVEMEAVDEGRSLAALAEAGVLHDSDVEAAADLLAGFHASARVIDNPDSVRSSLAPVKANAANLAEAGVGILEPDRVRAAADFTASRTARCEPELRRRAAAGLIREGHGDLRAEHAIIPLDGPPYVYDCIEFDPRLREIDVAADLAFLVMDLTRLGRADCARDLVAGYRRAGGDPGEEGLLAFFAAYRAWVRALVACERAEEQADDPGAAARSAGEARELLALGHRFAWRARGRFLTVVCGVAASGKTTLAARLAAISRRPYLSSDGVRKRLAGLAPTERGAPELYVATAREEVYVALGREAAAAVRRGESPIVDATFHREFERLAFQHGLGDQRTVPLVIECSAPTNLLLRRAEARSADPTRVSDAGPEVVLQQLGERDPLEGRWERSRLSLCTDADPDLQVLEVERFIDRCGPGPAA